MIWILNGPNLNLLGVREPEVYGRGALQDLEAQCEGWAAEVGETARCFQSNYEGQLIDWLHQATQGASGVVLNAGGLTHTSVALRDAVAGILTPVVEVHLSNVHSREPFRHHSFLSAVCVGTVSGLGIYSYEAAIRFLARER